MYRERRRIGGTLVDLVPSLEFCPASLASAAPCELILVDDGSDDGTADVVARWLANEPRGCLQHVRLLRHARNRGKGAAVRTGLTAAQGRWRLIMDADNSCRVIEAGKLLTEARRTGAALAAGSRRVAQSVVDARRSRRLMGWGFQTALSVMGMRLLSDTQCGFKLYRRDLAEWIGRVAREDGWAFDLEHLLLARRAGARIAEVGVEWRHSDGGQLRSLRDGLVMLRRAAALRWSTPTRVPRLAASTVEVKPSVGTPAPEPVMAGSGAP